MKRLHVLALVAVLALGLALGYAVRAAAAPDPDDPPKVDVGAPANLTVGQLVNLICTCIDTKLHLEARFTYDAQDDVLTVHCYRWDGPPAQGTVWPPGPKVEDDVVLARFQYVLDLFHDLVSPHTTFSFEELPSRPTRS